MQIVEQLGAGAREEFKVEPGARQPGPHPMWRANIRLRSAGVQRGFCAKKWEQAGQDSAHLALGNNHSVRCRGQGAGEEQTLRANQRLQQELGSWILLS